MALSINPQVSQDSITTHLRTLYPHIPVIPDGLMDQEDDVIKKYADGSVKPFIVLWFRQPQRLRRGRSIADTRLDQRMASVDVVVVARSAPESRLVLNAVIDSMVGWKPENGGIMVESDRSLWGDARAVDFASRPSRWAATQSLNWGSKFTVKP